MLQRDEVRKIEIGKEFRIRIPNNKIHKVRSDFSGTPIYIRCTDGTGIIPPDIVLEPSDNIAEISFKNHLHYHTGQSYTFVIDEQRKVVVEYTQAPRETIAGQIQFREKVRKSQESLDCKFNSVNALSFDQSYFTRTIGQIVIQYKLEGKLGPLHEKFGVFSGAGFGALQAFSCALGYSTEELNTWYLENLLRSVRKGFVRKSWQMFTGVILGHDHSKYKSKPFEKEIRKFFKAKDLDGKRTGRDLTVKDCKKDVYIPVWDVSRLTEVITKKSAPDMPIWLAVCSSLVDPIFFEADRKLRDQWDGVLNGDVVKNNDVYLKQYNPDMSVTSVGSPVRVWDKGRGVLDDRSLLIKYSEAKHDTNLDWSREIGVKRYECTAVDELKQFDFSNYAINTAQKSGDIDV